MVKEYRMGVMMSPRMSRAKEQSYDDPPGSNSRVARDAANE
jgi:hypothetical protein